MRIDPGADIERLIGKTYAGRGRAYARQGRVREPTRTEGRRMVFARVRASGTASHTRTIAPDLADDGHLAGTGGECSCPGGYNCKHVAAVLFVAEPILRANDAPAPARTRVADPKTARYRQNSSCRWISGSGVTRALPAGIAGFIPGGIGLTLTAADTVILCDP
ncbi:MAG: SWIM zinc finger family protein [Rhodobacteraceae bacterium]|nr:SWIM zinc finger family protein [Paracoccaceae bacterium]